VIHLLPFLAAHPAAVISPAIKIVQWARSDTDRELTLRNTTEKRVFAAVCLWGQSGEATDTLSMGWFVVPPRSYEAVSIPVPRFGSRWVAVHGRSAKGTRAWTGSGDGSRVFSVVLPSYGGKLNESSRFTVQAPASNSPQVFMNQGGVSRVVDVRGRLLKMEGDFSYEMGV
jgi:hypothetical protein